LGRATTLVEIFCGRIASIKEITSPSMTKR
jgi:hypothetical protein